MSENPSITLPGTVEKIIKSPIPNEPDQAQIRVEGAEHLYRELRIDNVLTKVNGDQVTLQPGERVEVTVHAKPDATTAI
jgi:archaellum component FlaG (FlaF/FlaG flagellin family)